MSIGICFSPFKPTFFDWSVITANKKGAKKGQNGLKMKLF